MNRQEAIEVIMTTISSQDAVVSTTGLISREIYEKFDSVRNIYVPGSMGLASSIGLGLAMASQNRNVVVIDGDASLLMNLGSIVTIGNKQPANLLHIVIDNGAYSSCSEEKRRTTIMSRGKDIFNASFDVFAETYHSVRPGYPPQLYEDIKELCRIGSASRLLEIGAGSGIATAELAKFGCRVVAIEPGAHLAAITRKQTEGFKNVEILEETFESFQSSEQFDAILAFTAYHWIDAGIKYQKVLDLLVDAGSLVLVWNSFFLSDSKVTAEVISAHHQYLPAAFPSELSVAEVNEEVLSKLHRREQEVVQNLLLYTIALRKYFTVYNYNSETYPKLLNTFPKVAEAEERKRTRFLERISEIVQKHGMISVPVLTTLIACKVRSGFLHAISHPEGGP